MSPHPTRIPPGFGHSPHLVGLIAEAERLATRLAGAHAQDGEIAEELAAACAVASLRLDGSRLQARPDPELLERAAAALDAPAAAGDPGPAAAGPHRSPGSGEAGSSRDWLRTLRSGTDGLVDPPDALVTALEYLGVRRALEADDLATALLHEPRVALTELHRRLTRGLIDPHDAGRPRSTRQAVHDASVGRILYYPPEPADVTAQLSLLCGWLDSAAAREHAVVASGLLHLELLRLHPFDAANGRLARAAARLVLRARGLDPDGLAAVEMRLADDPVGTYDEVARTGRRRDATIWLERWGEAVTGGLRLAASRLGLLEPSVPGRAEHFLDTHGAAPAESGPARPATAAPDGGTARSFTVADYRAGAGVGREDARADLAALLEAGRVARVPGSRGLRFVVRPPSGWRSPRDE